jgi:endonuclease YncB( thermonuclease family)
MSRQKRILLLVLVIIAGMGYMVYRVATFDPNYVRKVEDADQLVLKTNQIVKLIGLEVPPAVDGDVGAEAQRFVIDLVQDRYIRVETDERKRMPGNNWILGYVFVERGGEEVFVNKELLRLGYARTRPQAPNLKRTDEFQAAEDEARAAKLGIWRDGYRWPAVDPSRTAADVPDGFCAR